MDFMEESKNASDLISRYYNRIATPNRGSAQVSNERNIDWQWIDEFVGDFYAGGAVRSQDAEALGVSSGTDRTVTCKAYVKWRAWQMAYNFWQCNVRHTDVELWNDSVLVSVVTEVTMGYDYKTYNTLHELFVLSPGPDGKIVRHVSEFVGLRLIPSSWTARPAGI